MSLRGGPENATNLSSILCKKSGVLTQRIDCVQHTGTHCDAPRHVMETEFDGRRARYTHEMPVDAYMGDDSMVRCVAEIDEDDVNHVPERVYNYGGF